MDKQEIMTELQWAMFIKQPERCLQKALVLLPVPLDVLRLPHSPFPFVTSLDGEEKGCRLKQKVQAKC